VRALEARTEGAAPSGARTPPAENGM
jgi:hypothetical protein